MKKGEEEPEFRFICMSHVILNQKIYRAIFVWSRSIWKNAISLYYLFNLTKWEHPAWVTTIAIRSILLANSKYLNSHSFG